MKFKILILNVLAAVFLLSFAGSAKANILGIDVSRWQGEIDWDVVNQQFVGFAFIKAGGSDDGFYTDPQFQRNRAEVRRLGMLRGYYYFAGGGDPVQEAVHFANIVTPLEPGELVVLDFEVNHPDPVGYSRQFLVTTEEILGVKPLLYTYMNKIWTLDWSPVVNNGNKLWGAIYDEERFAVPRPGAWPAVSIKQYTSSANLGGISANSVDMNNFGGTAEEFQAMGYQEQPISEPMPAPMPEPMPEPMPTLIGYEGIKASVAALSTLPADSSTTDSNGGQATPTDSTGTEEGSEPGQTTEGGSDSGTQDATGTVTTSGPDTNTNHEVGAPADGGAAAADGLRTTDAGLERAQAAADAGKSSSAADVLPVSNSYDTFVRDALGLGLGDSLPKLPLLQS